MIDNTASVTWHGEVKSGSGTLSLDTSKAAGPLDVTFPARLGEDQGKTNPDELIAAAHATCYAMSLSGALGRAGSPPEKLDAKAVVTFSTEGGPHIAKVALSVVGTVPGISEDDFVEVAQQAKEGCAVSKLMAGNVEITLDAALA